MNCIYKSSISLFSFLVIISYAFSQKYFYCDYKSFDAKDGYISFYNGGYITQDSKGLIWIGGDNGLYCFDGIHFKNYRHNPLDSNSLPFNLVNFNYQDNKGNYWVYVLNKGLFRFDIRYGSFIKFSYKNQKEFDINQYQPQLPVEDILDQLWFPVAGYGVAKWNDRQNTMTAYKICPDGSCGTFYSSSWVTHGIEDTTDNTLWFSTNDGLIHFFPNDGHYTIFKDASYKEPRSNVYSNLYFDSQHKLWIATWGHGLKQFDPVSLKFKEYRWHEGISGTYNICTGISPYDNEHLWIASYDNGFMLFNIKTNTFKEVRKPEAEKGPLAISQMLCTGDIIWANNDKQFFKVTRRGSPFLYYPLQTKNNTLDDISLNCFLRTGDMLYYGTRYNGHFGTYDLKTGKQTNIRLNNDGDESVFNLAEDSGLIWVTTFSGIFIYNPKTKHVQQPVLKNYAGYQHMKYRDVLHDRDGTVWMATDKGLMHYNPVKQTAEVLTTSNEGKKHLQQNDIFSLFQDKKGNIWFGSAAVGLACYRRQDDTIIYFNKTRGKDFPEENCSSIKETEDGKILFVLEYLGFCVLENPFTSKEKITLYNSSDGLPSDYMQYVHVDKHNRIWLYTSNGVCSFDPVAKKAISFNSQDGLLTNNCDSYPYEDSLGNMYVGFTKAFQIFKPDSLLQNKPASVSIYITSLWVNGKEWPLNSTLLKSLELDHTQSGISFNVAAITPELQNDFRYAYRMEGLEGHWTFTAEKANGQYTNLPPGKYQLHVKAASRDGEWYKQEYFLPVIIHPPWYKTAWFYSLIGVSVLSLLYAFYRYRVNQLLRLERMRTNISGDLHDDIGSTLTSISYYSELVKMQLNKDDENAVKPFLDKISNNARYMVNAMNDIVWVINPQNDDTSKLISRMKYHAAEMLGERNIHYTININEQIEKLKLNMQQRKNLYLIYKEALHNAVKYADCDAILIDFLQADHHITLHIKDNGRGFNVQSSDKGNGLQNMQKRANEIKGKLTIDSGKEKGTCIKVTCKIT